MSVIYSKGAHSIDLVVPDDKRYSLLFHNIKRMVHAAWEAVRKKDPDDIFLEEKFREADSDGTGDLSLPEVGACVCACMCVCAGVAKRQSSRARAVTTGTPLSCIS